MNVSVDLSKRIEYWINCLLKHLRPFVCSLYLILSSSHAEGKISSDPMNDISPNSIESVLSVDPENFKKPTISFDSLPTQSVSTIDSIALDIKKPKKLSSLDSLQNPLKSVLTYDSTVANNVQEISELYTLFSYVKEILPNIEQKLKEKNVRITITKNGLYQKTKWHTVLAHTHRWTNDITISISPDCSDEIIAAIHEIGHVIESEHHYSQFPEFRKYHRKFYSTLVERWEAYYTHYRDKDTIRAGNEWFATLVWELLLKKIQYSHLKIIEKDFTSRPITHAEVNFLLLERFKERYDNDTNLFILLVACIEEWYGESIFSFEPNFDQLVTKKKEELRLWEELLKKK